MLRDKIVAVELQMKAKLIEIKATFQQSGDKGATVEKEFRSFLREYLPRRLDIGTGEIIDTKGHRSKQTDVIIVNESHPLTFSRDLPGLFFIEGVCAAGEVKSILTSEELEKALENSFSFKQLYAEPDLNAQQFCKPSDYRRFYAHPPYFLVAFSSQLGLDSILQRTRDFLKAKEVGLNEINKVLDAVFVFEKGWVINFGDGQGCFQFVTEDSKPAEGWAPNESITVLFDLLAWLEAVMPTVTRIIPILPLYMVPNATGKK